MTKCKDCGYVMKYAKIKMCLQILILLLTSSEYRKAFSSGNLINSKWVMYCPNCNKRPSGWIND